MSILRRVYLTCFNLWSAAWWAYTLFLIGQHYLKYGTSGNLWNTIEIPLKIAQTGAVMEILHSAVGLVRSPLATTFLQVLSRIGLLWGVCNLAPETHIYLGFLTMVASWSLVEVPRYLYYAIDQVSKTAMPYWMLYLRYSLFIVLYPSGISSEISCILKALPMFFDTHILSYPMPNYLNFGFDYAICTVVALALYAPGAPFMYMHMMKERSKKLGTDVKKVKTK